MIKVHNGTSSSIRRIDRGCSFALRLSYFRKYLANYSDSVLMGLHPRVSRKRKALTKLYNIAACGAYPKNPMDRPAAPTPNHKTNAPHAANFARV